VAAIRTTLICFNSELRGNGCGVQCDAGGGSIRNCLIAGNSNTVSGQGAGVYFDNNNTYNVSLSCCTIVSNVATASAGSGIRIAAATSCLLSVSSCIIYSNGLSGTSDVYDANMSLRPILFNIAVLASTPGLPGRAISRPVRDLRVSPAGTTGWQATRRASMRARTRPG